MKLPVPFINPSNPIPNSPFYAPQTSYLFGPYGPIILGSGFAINYSTGTVFTSGGGGGISALTAGAGIQLIPSLITATGSIAATNSGVTPGVYTSPTITVDTFGRITLALSGTASTTTVVSPITNAGTPVAPVLGIQLATNGQLGAVQVGSNIDVSSGVISVASASTSIAGVVKLNNTLTSVSTTEALTAAKGKDLQDQISAVATGGASTLAGTFDASSGQMLTITNSGSAAGFTIGSDLPAAAPGNVDYFALVEEGGSYSPPGGGGPYNVSQGDWFLSNGSVWEFMNVGLDLPDATTGTAGIVELALDNETKAGTNTTFAVTPAGSFFTYLEKSVLTTKGVIATASGAEVPATLSATGNGNVLSVCSSTATGLRWINNPYLNSITCSAIDNKGALIVGTGSSTFTALPVGTLNQVLAVDLACTSGLKWTAAAATPVATPTVTGIMYGCTTSSNTALGYGVCIGTTNNVFIGCRAGGWALNSSSNNVAVGTQAAGHVSTGSSNVVIGTLAGVRLSTGVFNTLIGTRAGSQSTDPGNSNIMIGVCAGALVADPSSGNLFIGNNAGENYVNSGSNFIIGNGSRPSDVNGGNKVIIGNGIVSPGNVSTVYVGRGGCQCAWFRLTDSIGWNFASDANLKGGVTALPVNAEAFINDLRPVAYCFLDRNTKQPLDTKHCNAGFIAQEVEQAMETHGLKEITSLVTRPQHDEGYYRLSEDGFTPFVVKALQELFAKVEALKTKLESNG